LSVVIVVCCQVEVSATGFSPAQKGPSDCRFVLSLNLVNEEAMAQWGGGAVVSNKGEKSQFSPSEVSEKVFEKSVHKRRSPN